MELAEVITITVFSTGVGYLSIGVLIATAVNTYHEHRGRSIMQWSREEDDAWIKAWPVKAFKNLYRKVRYHGRSRKAEENHRGTSAQAGGGAHCTACGFPWPAVYPSCPACRAGTNHRSKPGAGTGSLGPMQTIPGGYAHGNVVTGLAVDLAVDPAPDPEIVKVDMPVLAHRAAGLSLEDLDKPFRRVVGNHDAFGVFEQAKCARWDLDAITRIRQQYIGIGMGYFDTHHAPAWDCECGFYALPPDLPSTYETNTTINLVVELGGKVIECEQGYRAEYQKVVEAQVPPCPVCRHQSDVIEASRTSMTMTGFGCKAHTIPYTTADRVLVGVDELAKLLPVPVTRRGKVSHR